MTDQHTRGPRIALRCAIVAAVVLGVMAVLLFARYGTLEPCEALKEDLVGQIAEELAAVEPAEGEEDVRFLAVILAEQLTEIALSEKTAGQCLRGLWRLHVTGEDVFGE